MKTGRFMGLFGALLLASMNPTAEVPSFRGMNYARGGYNPEFYPKRTKFKGWMRERRRSTFNKNRQK
jgi:hypothetical protein